MEYGTIKRRNFIIKNKKLPLNHSKNKEEKFMGCWLITQQKNYREKQCIMKNEHIYNRWVDYKVYFKTYDEEWCIMLSKVKQFIIDYNREPSRYSKNNDEKNMGNWVCNQKHKYKKQQGIMKNEEIYK